MRALELRIDRCITRRMHLAKVTCHSARFGLDGSLSKSNDTLRINLAGITGHCEAARRDTTMPRHMKASRGLTKAAEQQQDFDILIHCE